MEIFTATLLLSLLAQAPAPEDPAKALFELEARIGELERSAAEASAADQRAAESRERRLEGLTRSVTLLEQAFELLLAGKFEAQGPLGQAVGELESIQAEARSQGGVQEVALVDLALTQARRGAETLAQRDFLASLLSVQDALWTAYKARSETQASRAPATF